MDKWQRLLAIPHPSSLTPHSAPAAWANTDWDTLIFSAPFRRLQNKTQVFPLPGSIFVHNRLTHSLEVASVGSRLARLGLQAIGRDDLAQAAGAITGAACLAHDIGNPPFGHAGERAIAAFFAEGEGTELKEKVLNELPEEQGCIFWTDLCCFDGNAAGLHLLIRQYGAARWGGQPLSTPCLAATVKYPYSSTLASAPHKFGFFLTDTAAYSAIASRLGLSQTTSPDNAPSCAVCYPRHPLSYFVEAADDICYQIMDLEDAAKLGIIRDDERLALLRSFLPAGPVAAPTSLLVISTLINEAARVFQTSVADGALPFQDSLIDHMQEPLLQAYTACSCLARNRIYKAQAVVDVEMAGYYIITTLLSLLTRAALRPDKSSNQILLSRVPPQYGIDNPSLAARLFAVVDYVAGMTDVYALDLYRKITGHSLPSV